MKHDPTMDDLSAYGSDAYCARRLGKTLDWFKQNRAMLEREGFPSKDMLVCLTAKADIEAFLARRRQVADAVRVVSAKEHHGDMNPGVNLDAL